MDNFLSAWTWSLTDDSDGYQLLQPGIYRARIKRFEQGEFKGSAKLSACPRAIITLAVETENGPQEVTVSLLVHKKLEWKLSQFFRAIGRKKHGEELQMDWSGLVGLPLKVHITIRSYTNRDGEERQCNDVDRFYDFDPDDFPKDPDWLADAMSADTADELDEIF